MIEVQSFSRMVTRGREERARDVALLVERVRARMRGILKKSRQGVDGVLACVARGADDQDCGLHGEL